ncbi:MAG: hypothetical protein RBR01_04260 [Desulfobacterales bacterium]|nr:hypothetical protein [Desulfobacterales bacterium]MDD3081202.1 hypothetical protein [Desulfobacterales bacterium]MDD3950250.1 hypothetical protein [Desulfobacterales bacterium]MDY0377631.1 hypothetical protein [Desulfobacterales bacterium]
MLKTAFKCFSIIVIEVVAHGLQLSEKTAIDQAKPSAVLEQSDVFNGMEPAEMKGPVNGQRFYRTDPEKRPVREYLPGTGDQVRNPAAVAVRAAGFFPQNNLGQILWFY